MRQAQVITGKLYPSAGVRILISLAMSAFWERATGMPIRKFSDFTLNGSIGSLSTGYSLDNPETGLPGVDSVDMLHTTARTIDRMFQSNPDATLLRNGIRDGIRKVRQGLSPFRSYRYSGIDYLAHRLEQRVRKGGTHYDSDVLYAELQRNFGDASMRDCKKSNLIAAISETKGGMWFGDIDEKRFPSAGIEHRNYFKVMRMGEKKTNKFPVYNDVRVAEAIMAATAIPGYMKYYFIEGLQQRFMDAGQYGNGIFADAVEEFQMRAENRLRIDRENKNSFTRTFERLTGRSIDLEAKPIMRMIVMDIGREDHVQFGEENGVALEAMNAMNRTGGLVTEGAFVRMTNKYNHLSQAAIGLDAIVRIDRRIRSRPEFKKIAGMRNLPRLAAMPSTDIRDGRRENVLLMMDHCRREAIQERHKITRESNLRMETLVARGEATTQEADKVARNLERISTPEGAGRIFDEFSIHANNIERIMAGVPEEKPVPKVLTGWVMDIPAIDAKPAMV